MHEDVTNDLVIVDMAGKEITRYKARGKFKFSTRRSPASNHLRNAHFSGEKEHMVWFCGDSSVCKVNLKDLSFKEVKKVMDSQGKGRDGVALRVLVKANGLEYLLLYAYQDSFKISYINEEKSEVLNIAAEASYPGCTRC